jgi:hypothetical protein
MLVSSCVAVGNTASHIACSTEVSTCNLADVHLHVFQGCVDQCQLLSMNFFSHVFNKIVGKDEEDAHVDGSAPSGTAREPDLQSLRDVVFDLSIPSEARLCQQVQHLEAKNDADR